MTAPYQHRAAVVAVYLNRSVDRAAQKDAVRDEVKLLLTL